MLSAEVQLPLAETSDSETGLEHGEVTVLSMQMKLLGSTVGPQEAGHQKNARRGGILNSDRVPSPALEESPMPRTAWTMCQREGGMG